MKNTIVYLSRRIRFLILTRQADALLRRANARYAPSRHLIGYVPQMPTAKKPHTERSWVICAALIAAFLVGAFVRDGDDAPQAGGNRAQFVSACSDVQLATADHASVR